MQRTVEILEPLLASLLTLEWEITSQNIMRFEKELAGLGEKLGEDPHSKRLIELSHPICHYLRVRKAEASPASMQFLKEAIRTLHLFWQERKLDVSERKKAVKELLDKYDNLMADVQEIDATTPQATRSESIQIAASPASRAAAKGAPKRKARVKKVAVRKGQKLSPTAQVLEAIRNHRSGIEIVALKKATGLPDSSIRSILYRASKEGKIKRVRRGVYVCA